MHLPVEIYRDLCCPECLNQLAESDGNLECQNLNCEKKYPIIDGIPILINDSKSIFTIQDFIDKKNTTFNLTESKIKTLLKNFVPAISNNINAKVNYKELLDLLTKNEERSKVLIIGGSIIGEGMDEFVTSSKLSILESDVSYGPRTKIIFDAHSIPFPDEHFECVVLQAVLEHVLDPYHCVKEVHRVLKRDGLVYAETPFMQQVHMGKFDFHRFTHLGHRRLFRQFSEIKSGAICGSGMALAWAYNYFIFSFLRTKKMRELIIPFTRVTSFFWKYFDYLTINNPGTFDAASGYFFMGRKSEKILEDRELLKQYRGLY